MSHCSKCRKPTNTCRCPNGVGADGISTGQLSAQIAQLNDQVNTITTAIEAFINGHPILMIQNSDDIACFDFTSGLGTTTWLGWGLCTGQSYHNATTNKNILSPNLLDKLIVGAGGTYAVGDTGGSNTVSLTALQNGTHSHTITDPGHTHVATQTAHTHGIDEHGGHQHGFVSTPITVPPFLTDIEDQQHHHGYAAPNVTIGYTTGTAHADTSNLSANDQTTVEDLSHHHEVTIPPFVASGTTAIVATGLSIIAEQPPITVNPATTGITEATSGNGDPHENRPPYYSLIFCIKI